MAKKRLVISFENLPPGMTEEIAKQYPEGYANHVMKVQGANNTFFYAILVDSPDVTYLVKVKVKKDKKPENEDDLIPDLADSPNEEEPSGSNEEPFTDHAEE